MAINVNAQGVDNIDFGKINTPEQTGNYKAPAGDPRLRYAYDKSIQTKQVKGLQGAPALANPYALFRFSSADGQNELMFDVENTPGVTPPESLNPTAEKIIEWSKDKKSMPYYLSDFLYAKYYGKVPNNYMVTLRRFPFPTFDNLSFNQTNEFPPSAQAITWMSKETNNTLGDILSFGTGLKWSEMKAEIQKVQGKEQDFSNDGNPFGNSSIIKGVSKLTSKYRRPDVTKREELNSEYWYNADDDQLYMNGLYGPINVIDETMRRERGLDFKHDITLNFHYNLKSYNGINPKMAMLDILCNMLALTFNNGQFWGGSIRYFPNYPEVPWLGDQDKFYNGDFSGFFESVTSDLGDAAGNLGGYLSKLFSDPIGALKDLAADFGGELLGKQAARNHPGMLGIKSLLTGNPVGDWHLVVGNPLNPIATIGNLICKNADFKFSDKLGADDFPEEMIVTITLAHGKPRDKSDVESMFNLGEGRMYFSPPSGEENSNKPKNGAVKKSANKGILGFHNETEFDDYQRTAQSTATRATALANYSITEIKAAIGASTGS